MNTMTSENTLPYSPQAWGVPNIDGIKIMRNTSSHRRGGEPEGLDNMDFIEKSSHTGGGEPRPSHCDAKEGCPPTGVGNPVSMGPVY